MIRVCDIVLRKRESLLEIRVRRRESHWAARGAKPPAAIKRRTGATRRIHTHALVIHQLPAMTPKHEIITRSRGAPSRCGGGNVRHRDKPVALLHHTAVAVPITGKGGCPWLESLSSTFRDAATVKLSGDRLRTLFAAARLPTVGQETVRGLGASADAVMDQLGGATGAPRCERR